MNTEARDRAAIAELIEMGRFDEAYDRCIPMAERGSPAAQLYLGWLYQSGSGVVRDYKIAEHWYRRALERAPERAEFYLGTLCWERGDPVEARLWFEQAASKEFVPATYALSKMHRFGYGVPIDEALGLKLLERAALRGHLFARRDIARHMIRGRRGLAAILPGLAELAKVMVAVFRLGLKDPHSDLLLRLYRGACT